MHFKILLVLIIKFFDVFKNYHHCRESMYLKGNKVERILNTFRSFVIYCAIFQPLGKMTDKIGKITIQYKTGTIIPNILKLRPTKAIFCKLFLGNAIRENLLGMFNDERALCYFRQGGAVR
jgi:hypothetical protein